MGRHSASDGAGAGSRPESPRARAERADGPAIAAGPEAKGPVPEASKPRRESAIRADVRLLRADRGLSIRCAVAVVLPFVALLVVLLQLGRAGSFFIWLWIPAILAGVAGGGLLDRAHRKAAATSGEIPERTR